MCVYYMYLIDFNCIHMWLKHAQTGQVSKCSTTECPPLSIWLDSRLRQVPQQISQANVLTHLHPELGRRCVVLWLLWGVDVANACVNWLLYVIVIAVCIILHVGLHVFTVDICDKANVSSKNVQTQ